MNIVYLINIFSLLAYRNYRDIRPEKEYHIPTPKEFFADHPELIVLLVIGFIGFLVYLWFSRPYACQWCGKTVKHNSPMRKVEDGHVFCSMKCAFRYLNEAADLEDRERTAGQSTNINISDRNKYLNNH